MCDLNYYVQEMVCAIDEADLLETGCALAAIATVLMDCLANILILI